MRLIAVENATLVVCSLVIGGGLAMLATRAVESRLFGVSPLDARTFGIAGLTMVVAASAALLLPLRRAMRVDPVETLHHD
jgi:ABC-type antimicrobial peptide transport system permease subunit